MIFPINIHIGSLIIPSHPVFEVLAFFIGYGYYLFLKTNRKSEPLMPEAEWWIVIGMAAGAFIGSRLIAALENPAIFLHSTTWLYYVGGQSIAGGIAGGMLGVEIAKKILHIKRRTGNLFVYPLILGIIIGRIGCFLTGIADGTVGLPCNFPWCFSQGDSISRHPTSLYEILFLILLWIGIKRIEKRKTMKEGDLFGIFMFCYAAFRFFVEFIKPRNLLWLDLSSIQLLAVTLMVYYAIYFIKRQKNLP
jgi:phosphatidylglycerol:prolipoprotein diacylglycerol transferase